MNSSEKKEHDTRRKVVPSEGRTTEMVNICVKTPEFFKTYFIVKIRNYNNLDESQRHYSE